MHWKAVALCLGLILEGTASSVAGASLQSGPGGTFVDGVRIPDTCPKPTPPSGPLATPGVTDIPYNHRAFVGETDAQMYERHKRDADAPCENAFRAKVDALYDAAQRTDNAKATANAALRGHEYLDRKGEMYLYYHGPLQEGFLVLRLTGSRVIFGTFIEITPDHYSSQRQFYNCDLVSRSCVAFTPGFGEFVYGTPPVNHLLSRIIRDARAGRLRGFSNPDYFLSVTPW